jgi:hypothetical protein
MIKKCEINLMLKITIQILSSKEFGMFSSIWEWEESDNG